MTLNRALLYTAAALFGIVISSYVYAHAMVQSLMRGTKLSAADQCEETAVAPTTNPNKMLFISCGGFLD